MKTSQGKYKEPHLSRSFSLTRKTLDIIDGLAKKRGINPSKAFELIVSEYKKAQRIEHDEVDELFGKETKPISNVVTCQECKANYSENLLTCPGCGKERILR